MSKPLLRPNLRLARLRPLGALMVVGVFLFALASPSQAANFALSYSGRLTQSNGAPVTGPVDLKIKFWTAASAGTQLGQDFDYAATSLSQGVFSLELNLSAAQVEQVFADGSQPVFIEVTAAGKTYPRQQYLYVPLALRVPTDGKTVAFDSDGQLALALTAAPGANQFVTKDANGNLVWGTPATATTLQGQSISNSTPASGQVLSYSNGQWTPTTISTWNDGGTLSGSLNMGGQTLTGLAAPTNASDAVPKSYGDTTYLKLSGGTMSGAVAMGGQDLSNTGNLLMLPSKVLALSGNTLDPSGLSSTDRGKMWFNSTNNQIKYFDGTTVQTVGATGAGITSFNGLSASAQTLANGTSGSSPQFSSSGSVHTLNIPMASGTGVTAGLLANTDYATFSSKLSSITAGAGLSGGLMTGSGTVSLPNIGGIGTYSKVTTDAQGRVTSGSTLASSDLPPVNASLIGTGTLAVTNGGTGVASFTNNGVVIGSGASNLSATAAGAQYNVLTVNASNQPVFGALNLTSTAAVSGTLPTSSGGTGLNSTPSNGQIPIGNGSGYSLAMLGQGATQGVSVANGVGTITLDTAQDIRTTASPSFAALNLSGNANAGTNMMLAATHVAGSGDNTSTPSVGTVRGAAANGTNLPGKALTISAGNGTGTGASGSIYLQTAPAGVSGSSADTLSPALTVTPTGNIGLGSVAPAGKLDVNGSICLNGSNCISSWPGGGTTAVTSVTAGAGLVGGPITATGSLSLAAVGSVGSYTKVVTDAYGRVVGSSSLLASDIPSLAASAITSGTLSLATIPSLPASSITSGTLALSVVPSLPASAITSGTFALSTVPALPANTITSGSFSAAQIPPLAASIITSGTFALSTVPALPASTITSGSFSSTQIPPLAASIITSGTFALSTVASLPASSITSGTLGASVIPNLASTYVAITGSTMSGVLNLPSNGLVAGTSQFVLANGNVGIGSTSPGASLDVESAATTGNNILGLFLQSGLPAGNNTYLKLGQSLTNNDEADIAFYYAGSGSASNKLNFGFYSTLPLLTITAGSNIGIGSTAPAAQLDVVGALGTTTVGSFHTNPNATGQGEAALITLDNTYGAGNYKSQLAFDSAGTAKWSVGVDYYGNGTQNFYIYDAPNNFPRLWIDAVGNVGINTLSPQTTLNVANGDGTTGGLRFGDEVSGYGYDIFPQSANNGLFQNSLVISAVGDTNLRHTLGTNGGAGAIVLQTTAGTALGGTGVPTPRVTIAPLGNVGIGSLSPAATLDVTGNANISSGVGTVIYSTQPSSNYSQNINGTFVLTGESLAITVPAGVSRRYRIVMRQDASCSINAGAQFILGTSNSSYGTGDIFVAQLFVSNYGGNTVSAETYVTLAAGTTTTYYMWAYTNGACSPFTVLNASTNNRMNCDLFAVQM